jgi:hypothetical protein
MMTKQMYIVGERFGKEVRPLELFSTETEARQWFELYRYQMALTVEPVKVTIERMGAGDV